MLVALICPFGAMVDPCLISAASLETFQSDVAGLGMARTLDYNDWQRVQATLCGRPSHLEDPRNTNGKAMFAVSQGTCLSENLC